MASTTGRIVCTAATGLLLTGCAATVAPDPATAAGPTTGRSAQPEPSPSRPPSPTTTPMATTVAPGDPAAAGLPRCTSAQVSGAFSPLDSAMGTRGVRVIVTNTGSQACTIYGYGSLEMFADADARPANIVLNRVSDPEPAVVVLQPGGRASKTLSWRPPSDTAAVSGDCTPPIGFASVILPDDTQAFTVEGDLGEVCDNREVDGRAYVAGDH